MAMRYKETPQKSNHFGRIHKKIHGIITYYVIYLTHTEIIDIYIYIYMIF